jgi:hypothetical protein
MGVGEKGWIVLGTRFRCHQIPVDLEAELAALLQGFPQADPDGIVGDAVDLRVEGYDGSGGVLLGPGGERWDLQREMAPLGSQIEYRIVNEAIARARDRYVLHAGAVEGPRGTCLIIGESGAGKTSLTLWLWASGLRLATDDLCPILHGTLAAERFPRALHMDCEYSPRLLAKIPPRPPSYPADYYPFPDALAGDPAPVADLLVLERGPLAEGEIFPLSQAEAAHHLLRAVIKSPGFDYGQALADMIALSTRCRAHLMRSSTPEGAGARALDLLTG